MSVTPSPKPSQTPTPKTTATSTVEPSHTPTITPTTSPTLTPSPTLTATPSPEPHAGDVRIVLRGGLQVEQVYVPAGEFLMGSSAAASENETPQRLIYLDAFWIDRYESTNQQYFGCQKAGSCPPPASSSSRSRPSYYYEVNLAFADYPVIYISWNAASAYCEWAGVRLPTEAEWEKAARGTDGRPYPWGTLPPTCGLANHDLYGEYVCFNPPDTVGIGRYPEGASPYGALNMAGNVSEWVADWYDAKYYLIGPAVNPLGPVLGSNKVIRGGGFSTENVTTTYRGQSSPDEEYPDVGVRCAGD